MKILKKIQKFFQVVYALIPFELVVFAAFLIGYLQIFKDPITTIGLILLLVIWVIARVVIEYFYYHVFYEEDDDTQKDTLKENIEEFYKRKLLANSISKEQYDDYMKLLSKKSLEDLIDIQIGAEQAEAAVKEVIKRERKPKSSVQVEVKDSDDTLENKS